MISFSLFKAGISLIFVSICGYFYNHICQKKYFESIIKKKEEQLRVKKESLLENNEAFDDDVTNISLKDLSERLKNGQIDALNVLKSFQAKALLKDKEYNFITDFNPHAEIEALNSTTKNGLLVGIPISIKDFFYVKDCDCTYGMPSLCFKPAECDSSVVQSLRMQGAIPFVITNMCQTGMTIETSNPIFGETLNPLNKKRTCGGSSGGEGAILASGGSILGLGSDIGGSIRIPSSYCGLFGLKPTANRLSFRNIPTLFHDQNFINVSSGPMARRFDDLLTFFKALTSSDQFYIDPYRPPLCFNEKLFLDKKPLRIGYYFKLGNDQVTPVPAVVRAVNLAKTSLETAGHTLVEFNIPKVDKAIHDLYTKSLFSDGGYGFINTFIKYNPVDSCISLLYYLLRMPKILKILISYAIYPFNKNFSFGLYSTIAVTSVYDLWKLKDALNDYKEEVLSKIENEQLDGIICPVLPITAPLCGTSKYLVDIVTYTAIYNLLDYPAGSVPVTKVNQSDIDELIKGYPRDTLTHRQIIAVQKDSLNMPVGIQCVTLPWREELCLKIMGDIDTHLSH